MIRWLSEPVKVRRFWVVALASYMLGGLLAAPANLARLIEIWRHDPGRLALIAVVVLVSLAIACAMTGMFISRDQRDD